VTLLLEAASLLLNTVAMGTSAQSSASPGPAVESGDEAGLVFQELVSKLLNECGIGVKVDEIMAGQQTQEMVSEEKPFGEQNLTEGIAQAECLLGSMGVVFETPEKAAFEAVITSAPDQSKTTLLPESVSIRITPADAAVDSNVSVEPEIPAHMAQSELPMVGNEVLDTISEAQPEASTQETESKVAIQTEALDEAVGHIQASPEKIADTKLAANVAAEPASGEAKAGQNMETSPNPLGEILAGRKPETNLGMASQAAASASDEAIEFIPVGPPDKLIDSDKISRFTGQVYAVGLGSTEEAGLSPVEKAWQEQDVHNNGKPESGAGWLLTPGIDPPGFKATEAVQGAQVHLPLEQTVSAKVINQIVKAAKVHITEGRSDITLRLDPPHLGTVQMNVSVVEGTVTATLQTSTEAARQVLQSDLVTLRQNLADAGINVDKIEVSVNSNPDHSQGWNLDSGNREWVSGGRANGGAWYGSGLREPEFITDTVVTARGMSSGRLDFLA